MSQNQPKIVVTDSFFETLLLKRAQNNERLAAEGLPPRTDELPYISESDADALAADEAKRRASRPAQNTAASLAPPPPTRGPLCRAAKAKVAERTSAIPGFDRHSRKCQICRSPYVDDIEQLYLQWESVHLICRYFRLSDTDTLYRHARAAGLDVLRRQNPRWVLEQFIEQWRTVKITSSTVIRSIRALSCLDEKGRWTDPPSTHILVRGTDASTTDTRSSDSGLPEPGVTSTTDIREASPAAVSPALRSSAVAREVEGSRATTHSLALSSPAVAGEVEGSFENSSADSPATRSHLTNSLRQGTPFYPEARRAAVPESLQNSGVLTPEVSRCETDGSHSPALSLPAVAAEVEGSPSTEQREPHDENSSADPSFNWPLTTDHWPLSQT